MVMTVAPRAKIETIAIRAPPPTRTNAFDVVAHRTEAATCAERLLTKAKPTLPCSAGGRPTSEIAPPLVPESARSSPCFAAAGLPPAETLGAPLPGWACPGVAPLPAASSPSAAWPSESCLCSSPLSLRPSSGAVCASSSLATGSSAAAGASTDRLVHSITAAETSITSRRTSISARGAGRKKRSPMPSFACTPGPTMGRRTTASATV
mmetsp:Transcript_37778/g.106788  ORF Transcript_37778/g.106788 Transcript_37778/m.106788 type:complete len:208 (+) Transcript_37778:563-1186(+)